MSRLYALTCGLLASVALSGCGHRLIAFRTTNPVIEDRVTAGGSDSGTRMTVVSTRADRRTVLIVNQDRICAEPPPDVAEAVSSQAVARLSTQNIGAGAGMALQTALLQLAQRSQGLEYFRTASFVYCNMFVINRKITREQYNWYMSQAAADAAKLMALQIEKGSLPGTLGTVQVTNPQNVTIDATPLVKPETPAEAPAPAPVPAPGTTDETTTPVTQNPVPPGDPGDKVLPPAGPE